MNEARIGKPSIAVKPGDMLTFPQAKQVRVIKVLGIGIRRGPAPEAQLLYQDLSPPAPENSIPRNPRFDGKGRPTKKDRRAMRPFIKDGLD